MRKNSKEPVQSCTKLGRHIVSDPVVCHGKLTFAGTRVFVADVLSDVENGFAWDFISHRWGSGRVTRAAIAEAVHLARTALLDDDGRLLNRSERSGFSKAA
jgi:uncharacterized protein (DUF433 family)